MAFFYSTKFYLFSFVSVSPCKIQRTTAYIQSVKMVGIPAVSHPFNADFLHSFLLRYNLNKRDYLWTIYINKLTGDEDNRIVQLIQMYDKGGDLETTNEKQIELLLTLFGWVLSSSNQWLRDYTSKAMIEILKEHFHLCQIILEKFKNVNDPYIIQRLYGVVFGACCKRKNERGFQALAEYVYQVVFDQEKVYPDILLRDYARLIIERFLYENPKYTGVIDREKIVPPYSSDPIPEIEDQHYLEHEYNGAMFWLMHSMRFEGMGMKENKQIKCDIALIPIGGTYTMDAKKAAELVNIMQPDIVIPIHYGSIVGKKEDADVFAANVKKPVKVEIKMKY